MMSKFKHVKTMWAVGLVELVATCCRLTVSSAEAGYVHSEQELPCAVDPEQRALQGMLMRARAKVKDMIMKGNH